MGILRTAKYHNPQDMMDMSEYNDAPVAKAVKTVWFLNGDMVRVYHNTRSEGVVTLYNITQDKLQTILLQEWLKKRVPAYGVRATALLLNRNPHYLAQCAKRGLIPTPMGASKGGKRGLRIRAYYSEDDVFYLRDYFASKHWGRKRKDGLVTNNTTPTEAEVRRRMGNDMLQYTKNNEGEIVPIWRETV